MFTPAQLKLVIDSIVWAFRHTERNVAETGLSLLQVPGIETSTSL
jgi:exportin-1